MKGDVGGALAKKCGNAKVGNDGSINSYLVKEAKKLTKCLILPVAGHDVYGNVKLNASVVTVFDSFSQLIVCKIAACGTHTEMAACKINGISAKVNGAFKLFKISRRGEDLRSHISKSQQSLVAVKGRTKVSAAATWRGCFWYVDRASADSRVESSIISPFEEGSISILSLISISPYPEKIEKMKS